MTDTLISQTATLRAMPLGRRRDAKRRRMYQEIAVVVDQRDSLLRKLESGWTWLEAHPDAPDYAEREDRWLGWLRTYEGVCDALEHAGEALDA